MPIAIATLRERIAALEATLRERDLPALVVYAQGSALGPATRTHGHMRYLTDYDSHHVPAMLVLRPGREPVLIVVNVFARFYTAQYTWIREVRFVKPPLMAQTAAALCLEAAGDAQRLGLIGRAEMPVPVWEALVSAAPGREWVDMGAEVEAARVVKSPEQIAVHEKAGAICDRLFATLAREIRVGSRPGYQLQAELDRVAKCEGAEYCMTWLTIVPVADYSRFWRDECSRVPQRGDQVLLGIYLMYEGHWGHAVRTGSFGPATPAQQRVFAAAQAMTDGMLAALRPGSALNDVQRAAEAALRAADFGVSDDTIFRFRHAHALGHSYEDPIASAPFPQPYDGAGAEPPQVLARPGMLFEFHPNLFVPELAGACIGDMVLVTENGHRLLTSYPRGLLDWTQAPTDIAATPL